MAEHTFSIRGEWNGGLQGSGRIRAEGLDVAICRPKQLGGELDGTNPEELILGAATTCYLITFAAIAERKRLPITSVSIVSEATIHADVYVELRSMTHRPRISVAKGTPPEVVERVRASAERAESVCMISTALRGNVKMHVEPEIIVDEA